MRGGVAFAVTAVAIAAPAHAQQRLESDTGSRIAKPRAARQDEATAADAQGRARQVMAAFARCSLDRRPRDVKMVLSAPLDREYHSAIGRLASSDCLDSGSLRFRTIHLRGALFAELLRRRHAAERAQREWGPVIPAFDPAVPPAQTSVAMTHHVLVDFATCVAGNDREGATAFALAAEASEAETAALVKLRPQLGACWPEGRSVTLNRSTLKGPMAEALYRLPGDGSAPRQSETKN